MSELTHFRKAFNSPYLGASDIDDYKDITLTIDRVSMEKSKGLKEDDTFNIVYFKERYKPMLLNSTNAKTIKNLAKSPYIEKWAGIRITIYVLEGVKAFGAVTDALRIRPITAKAVKPQLTPTSKVWAKARERAQAGYTVKQFRVNYILTDENFELLCKK